MAESTVVRVKRDGLITHTDGTNTLTVSQEVGDFNLDVPRESVNHFADRGKIGAVPDLRKGDDQPMTFGYSKHLTDLGDTAEPEAYQTLLDLLFAYVGGYTDDNWTSTLGTHSDADTWTTKFTMDGASFGESDKTLTLPYGVIRGSIAEGDPDTITVSGTSWAVVPTLS